jgi:GDP-L-fucose synthase
VYLAAAKVGGIHANNSYPAEFIYHNLMIETNIIHSAYKPRRAEGCCSSARAASTRSLAPQPMREDALLTGTLEPTNEAYAIAKIAGIKLCESYNRQYGTDYRSVMPTNLYGPGDNYDLQNSHVIPAMIRKLHLAKLAAAHDWPAIEHDEARQRRHSRQTSERQLHDTSTGRSSPV